MTHQRGMANWWIFRCDWIVVYHYWELKLKHNRNSTSRFPIPELRTDIFFGFQNMLSLQPSETTILPSSKLEWKDKLFFQPFTPQIPSASYRFAFRFLKRQSLKEWRRRIAQFSCKISLPPSSFLNSPGTVPTQRG